MMINPIKCVYATSMLFLISCHDLSSDSEEKRELCVLAIDTNEFIPNPGLYNVSCDQKFLGVVIVEMEQKIVFCSSSICKNDCFSTILDIGDSIHMTTMVNSTRRECTFYRVIYDSIDTEEINNRINEINTIVSGLPK